MLWQSIPPELRTTYFTIPRIPAEYLSAFRANGDRGRAIDFRMLPEPIGHELPFCVWRIIELGGLVPYDPLDRLARYLSAVLESLPAGERAAPVADGGARYDMGSGTVGGVDTRERTHSERASQA